MYSDQHDSRLEKKNAVNLVNLFSASVLGSLFSCGVLE